MRTLLFIIICTPFLVCAQIDESDSLKLKADLSLTGFLQEGNVQTVIFRAKSGLSYRPSEKIVFKTQNSYVYQEFGKSKADEDILSLNFLYFDPSRKFYPLILGFVSTNFRRKIDLRTLFGAGVTYQVFSSNGEWLKLSLSSEYERTQFNEFRFNKMVYNGSEDINTFRSTIWVNGRYQLVEKRLIVTHESYFQPSLESSNNYRWQADIGLEMPLWEFLNFKINYLHTFESVVIESQKEEDMFLTFGLTLKSY